jgi:hypothetical protein
VVIWAHGSACQCVFYLLLTFERVYWLSLNLVRTLCHRRSRQSRNFCKGKFIPVFFFSTEHHAMKAYWGSGDIAAHILDLSTRWRWVVSSTPRPLYTQGKNPWYPLDRRPGGHQSRSGYVGEEKISQPLSGLEPPIIRPVAQSYTTELSRLLTS